MSYNDGLGVQFHRQPRPELWRQATSLQPVPADRASAIRMDVASSRSMTGRPTWPYYRVYRSSRIGRFDSASGREGCGKPRLSLLGCATRERQPGAREVVYVVSLTRHSMECASRSTFAPSSRSRSRSRSATNCAASSGESGATNALVTSRTRLCKDSKRT